MSLIGDALAICPAHRFAKTLCPSRYLRVSKDDVVYRKIRALMQWRTDLLMAGRFEDMAREFRLPLALYVDGQPLVVSTVDHLVGLLEQVQMGRRQRGTVNVLTEVTAMDLPRNGRFRVWLRHHEMDARGQITLQSDAVHYCNETPHGLRDVMVESTGCCLPDAWAVPKTQLATQG